MDTVIDRDAPHGACCGYGLDNAHWVGTVASVDYACDGRIRCEVYECMLTPRACARRHHRAKHAPPDPRMSMHDDGYDDDPHVQFSDAIACASCAAGASRLALRPDLCTDAVPEECSECRAAAWTSGQCRSCDWNGRRELEVDGFADASPSPWPDGAFIPRSRT